MELIFGLMFCLMIFDVFSLLAAIVLIVLEALKALFRLHQAVPVLFPGAAICALALWDVDHIGVALFYFYVALLVRNLVLRLR